MNLWKKILLIGIIVIVTYPMGWAINVYYGSPAYPFHWYHSFADNSRHSIGYFIIGYLFGWISLVLGVLDEGVQLFLKKGFSWYQICLKLGGAALGMIVRQFIKMRFVNPFRRNKDEGLTVKKLHEVARLMRKWRL